MIGAGPAGAERRRGGAWRGAGRALAKAPGAARLRFCGEAAAPENAEAASCENAPTQPLEPRGRRRRPSPAARDDRAAAAAQREAADRDRAAAAPIEKRRRSSQRPTWNGHAAARRPDFSNDVRKLAWRIVGRPQGIRNSRCAAFLMPCARRNVMMEDGGPCSASRSRTRVVGAGGRRCGAPGRRC